MVLTAFLPPRLRECAFIEKPEYRALWENRGWNQLLLALEGKYKQMTFESLLYIALIVAAAGVSGVAGYLLVYFSVYFRSDCQDFGDIGSRGAKRVGEALTRGQQNNKEIE
jgi:hypothetical protein